MQPQFLLVKLGRVMMIAKKQTVLDQNHLRRNQLQAGVFFEQLVGKNEQIQWWLSMADWQNSNWEAKAAF